MRLAHHLMTWEGWLNKNGLPFDLDTCLSEIKAAGYDGVELGGGEARLGKPEALRQKLADHGLELAAYGTAVTANPWPPNTEEYRRDMEYAAAFGVKVVSVCGGFLPEPRRTAFDSDYELFAENLGAALDYARSLGLTLAYHPHCGCLVETIEEVGRLSKFLPDVPLCVDTGHLIAVRSDPAELVALAPDRIAHVHLKDWNPQERRFTELGQGTAGLDFARFFAALREIGYSGWLVVERDDPPMPASDSAAISRAFLRSVETVAAHD